MVRIPILFAFVLAAGCVVGGDIDADGPPGANDDDESGNSEQPDAGPTPDGAPVGGDGGGIPAEQQALVDFGECMTRADFDANNIVALASLPTEQGQICADCHAGGQNNNYMNEDPALMFENIRTCTSYPGSCYILKYADLDPELNPILSTALADKAANSANHGGGIFEIPQGNLEDLQAFYDATLANYQAGDCGLDL